MAQIVNIADLREQARRKLPRFVFDFIDGGAEDEVSVRANRAGYDRITFRPRALVDVSKRDLSTTVLGKTVSLPVLLAPAGGSRLVCREGEVAAARAAGQEGAIFTLSAFSSYSIEEVAAAATAPLWFQLTMVRRRDVAAELIGRAQEAGYHVLCITADVPTVGKRERDLRNRMTIPPRVTPNKVVDVLRRPLWIRDYFTGPRIVLKNLEGLSATRGMRPDELWGFLLQELWTEATTWADVDWIRRIWKGPLVVKGIMTAEDARRALDCGANGVIVSNHGGRQLDSLPSTIGVLPEIVEAVGDRGEVFVDGGIRRGTDVVKAIALGAKACLAGRPWCFGLASGGEAGVRLALQIFRDEIDRTLALLGCTCLADVKRTAVRIDSR